MLLHYSPQARYVKSARDLSHIELARSDNISSLSGRGSPKRRMSFGGSQRSENISSGRSSHIDRQKNKSKNRRIFSFYSCSFLWYKGLIKRFTLCLVFPLSVGTGVLDCPQQKNFGRELVFSADLCYNGTNEKPPSEREPMDALVQLYGYGHYPVPL